MIHRVLAAVLIIFFSAAVNGGEVRPFVVGSMAQIEAQHQGHPFVMVLWSLSCTYCPAELNMLGELKLQYPALTLVLVATDTPEQATEIAARLQGHGLGGVEQWVFADAMPERLRFEIDRRWYGEVPRTYFYGKNLQRDVKMGVVKQEFLRQWLATTAVNP